VVADVAELPTSFFAVESRDDAVFALQALHVASMIESNAQTAAASVPAFISAAPTNLLRLTRYSSSSSSSSSSKSSSQSFSALLHMSSDQLAVVLAHTQSGVWSTAALDAQSNAHVLVSDGSSSSASSPTSESVSNARALVVTGAQTNTVSVSSSVVSVATPKAEQHGRPAALFLDLVRKSATTKYRVLVRAADGCLTAQRDGKVRLSNFLFVFVTFHCLEFSNFVVYV
jgi:hypothetical protein